MKLTTPDLVQLADRFPLSDETPLSYRPIIVWAMNDRLDHAELRSQLDGFAACGYGAVMTMPWGALPNEFMDDDWLDATECILVHAEAIGLEVWIWDDWIFGSGCAGGTVTENPAYRARGVQKGIDLIVEPGESIDISVPARTIAAATFDADKFGNPTGRSVPLDVEAGGKIQFVANVRTRLVLVCWQYVSGFQHSTTSHGEFLDPAIDAAACNIYISDDRDDWSVDMLNPAATDEYLARIHEVYRARFSSYFGGTLKGFFYDEPKVPTRQPWTENFVARFEAIKGYDITDFLPEIEIDYMMDAGDHSEFLRPEVVQRAAADYYDVWTTLVAESFYAPVQAWCQRHGVIATGHQLGDNSLEEMKHGGGVLFKNLSYSDMPGIDTISGQIAAGRFFDCPRYVGSVANALGKTRAMSESFAVYGHGVTLHQMRYVCMVQIVRGVNTFFMKLSNYNRERSKQFHPPELSDVNPIIKHYGQRFCNMTERVAHLMNGGRPDRAVALYIPFDHLYNEDLSFVAATDGVARQLAYNQVDFDYVWDGDIIGMTSAAGGIAAAGGRVYSHLLIPPGSRMSDGISARLDELGALREVDADALRELRRVHHQADACFAVVSENVPVAMRRRTTKSGDAICLFVNESASAETLVIELASQAQVHEFVPDSGEMSCIAQGAAGTPVAIEFDVEQSKMICVEPVAALDAEFQAPGAGAEILEITDWVLTLPDARDVTITDAFPDWQDLGFGGYTGVMRYTATFKLVEDCAACTLKLGELRHAATVLLDGREAGDAVYSPFVVALGDLSAGQHSLEIRVLNTSANTVYGDQARYDELAAQGAFKGTYETIYRRLDLEKLRSGLFGPVRLCR
jgi:hypothetical protein